MIKEPLAVSVSDACSLTSLKRSSVYACLKDGRLERRKCGRRTLVTMASIHRLLGEEAS